MLSNKIFKQSAYMTCDLIQTIVTVFINYINIIKFRVHFVALKVQMFEIVFKAHNLLY